MQLQLLVHLQPVLVHLLLLLLGKVIILLLYRVTLLHLVPAESLPHLGLVQSTLESHSCTFLGIILLSISWNHLTLLVSLLPAKLLNQAI